LVSRHKGYTNPGRGWWAGRLRLSTSSLTNVRRSFFFLYIIKYIIIYSSFFSFRLRHIFLHSGPFGSNGVYHAPRYISIPYIKTYCSRGGRVVICIVKFIMRSGFFGRGRPAIVIYTSTPILFSSSSFDVRYNMYKWREILSSTLSHQHVRLKRKKMYRDDIV
jgi:hypothetical protein